MGNANASTRLDNVQLSDYMCGIEHQFMGSEGYYRTLIQSTINGYHAYKVKPPIEVQLPCTRKPDNPYDAKVVVCKGLDRELIGMFRKTLHQSSAGFWRNPMQTGSQLFTLGGL